ncbi:NUDIX hydrolase [Micromonospora parathelypteridis]|uniref:Uncharacterized protein n=1 Tax=Micromonospora parathelypteridis TaxID=1839617 RepID=A0A840VLT5_9ACTN|nr:NUDIX hydrolase [Micromonospora parathelypteridis]MBB5477922.1 hypothetical protein [Micromonospora parathelypteridis]GGO12338.1 hypothetical protein GCM10011576_21620 [Micromonospora parathelypteridis]
MPAVTANPANPAVQPTRRSLPYRMGRLAGRSLAYCATLIPVALLALVTAPLGGADAVVARWRSLRTGLLGKSPTPAPARRPGRLAVLGHALLSLLLGALALLPIGVGLLVVLRGALYGVVVSGPYVGAWGGPTRGGAWLAHFLIGLPFAAAGLAALIGIAAMHQRLTRRLDGERGSRWLIPTMLLMALAGALLFVAWTHQI